MKTRYFIFLSVFLSFFIQSCKNKDVNLIVNITSVGYNNTHIGYLGGTLGITADIVAEKKVDNIEIRISPENGNWKLGNSSREFLSAWEFDTIYSEKYSNEINVSFSEEIPIPLNVDIGGYILDLKLKDNNGNETSVSEAFTLDYGK